MTQLASPKLPGAKGESGPALSLSPSFPCIMRIVSPPFSALSHSWVLSGGLAVSPRKCLLSDAGASVPGICCRLSSPGAAWTDGLWPLRVVKCAVVAPLPVCSLPASPASLSCSGWGKAVRIPGRETQLRVTMTPLICLIILDRYSGMNCVSCTQKGGLPGGSSGKEPACQCRRSQRRGFNPLVRKMPWRRAWQPTPVSCLENPMERGARWATVHFPS